MHKQVSVVAAGSYDRETIEAAVERHFALLGVEELLHPGMRVVLKPNLLMKRAPQRCTTTHPALVEAVSRRLLALGCGEVIIADSPGGPYTPVMLEGIYTATGMRAAAQASGARLNADYGSKTTPAPAGSLCPSFPIINPVAGADLVINLCKLKTHAMTGLSGAVKNLFGCVPGLLKPELHLRFPEKDRFGRMLMELGRMISPALTIVDAVESMEGDGPSAGTVRHTGLTLASRDIFAMDVALCHVIGVDPQRIEMVAASIAQGLAPPSAAELDWLGDGIPKPQKDYRMPASQRALDFSVPRFLQRPAAALLATRPKILGRKCIGCGKCAESCAPNAVTIQKGKAVIRYAKCIKCFCCHEMCPVQAVEITRLLGR